MLEVKRCPHCGSKDIARRPCGWKYSCDECNRVWAILDLTPTRGGLMELFELACEVEEDRQFVGKFAKKHSDKGVSL